MKITTTSSSATNHLNGLNGLRFIAACLVVNGHTKLISTALTNYSDNPVWNFFYNNASNAVTFFFVLSGFLITYLLLKEFEKKGTIEVKKFYLKRILRIFPLYYLILFLMLVLAPILFYFLHKDFSLYQSAQVVLYFLFLPNLVGTIGKLSHLWSIGVEEQFYLLWGPAIKYCRKFIVPISLFIIASKLIIEIFIPHKVLFSAVSWHTLFIHFITTFQIHYMAVGALGAYILIYSPNKILNKFWFSLSSQIIFIGLLFARLSFENIYLNNIYFDTLILPFLFLYVMLNVSQNEKSLLKTNGKIWDYLGDLSFGIYMFHLPIFYLLKPFFNKLTSIDNVTTQYIIFSLLIYATTIIAAASSFHFYEKRFRKFRPI